MSELSYKELQEQGVFGVPYRAFKIEGGKAIYYKVNNLGYTMRYDGVTWYALYGALIQNYKPL